MSSLSFKNLRRYVRLKKGMITMAKKAVGLSLIAAAVLAVAPLAGIAEPTPNSDKVAEEIESTEGGLSKAKAALAGAFSEVKSLGENIWGEDAKEARFKKKIDELKKQNSLIIDENVALKNKLVEKDVVSKMSYARIGSCLADMQDFFNNQIETKEVIE